MGNVIGDLCFPDNPKRRARAEQLRQGILFYVSQFDVAKAERDVKFAEMKTALDEVFTKLGLKTRDEIEKYIRDNIQNDADLKAYDELRDRLEKTDKIGNQIMDVFGLVGCVGFIGGTAVSLLGIISFATVLVGLEVLGGFAGLMTLAFIIMGIYDGAVLRQRLREAIPNMIHKRAEAYQYYNRMVVLNNWVTDIVGDLKDGEKFEEMKAHLTKRLVPEWNEWSLEKCLSDLRDEDIKRGAWMDEDGNGSYLYVGDDLEPGDEKIPSVDLTFTPQETGKPQTVTLELHGVLSDSACIAKSEQCTWFIRGKAVEDLSMLEKEVYDVEKVPDGKTGLQEIYKACHLKVNRVSFV